jgi:hypothetical protein
MPHDREDEGLRFYGVSEALNVSRVDVTKVKEYRAEAARLTGEASTGLLFRYLSANGTGSET